MAIVIADNLRTHTPAGARLVRQMLADCEVHAFNEGRIDLPPTDRQHWRDADGTEQGIQFIALHLADP
jgi:hypothetical protein